MVSKKFSVSVISFIAVILLSQLVASSVPAQKVYAAPTVTVNQTCIVENGINNYRTTFTGSGWPPSPNRGVIMLDGLLMSEREFSPTGDILGFGGGGPGGPAYGPGLHTVLAFHDANGNRQHDSGEASATTSFVSIVCGPNPCTQRSLSPSDATEMNSVVTNANGDLRVKTIHVEKEVFNCQAQPRPNSFWPIIVDVSIITEIIENVTAQPINKTIEVVTCQKNATNGDVLGCKLKVPSTNLPLNTSCSQYPLTLPVKMNSVVVSPGLVKTIKAEKEVFRCDVPINYKKIKDVTIFTEILENLSNGTSKKTYEVVTCLKDVAKAEVVACRTTKPRLL
jgi:hypothetical protein